MGIRINDPEIEHDDDCIHCVPPSGDLWPVGETPRFVYAYFSGLEACPTLNDPLPNHHWFKCEQDDSYPCAYIHTGASWIVTFAVWNIGTGGSFLGLTHVTDGNAFVWHGMKCPEEYTFFPNGLVACPPANCAHNGSGLVHWTEAPRELIEDFGLIIGPRLHYECAMHEDGDIVHKMCDIRDGTNVKFKVTRS